MAVFDTTGQQARSRGMPGLRAPSAGMVAAAALVAGAALLPVVQSSSATTAGYEIRRLERQRADLQAAIYNAQTEIAELGSLDRIDREARGRLGMVPAQQVVVVRVAEPAPSGWHVPARFLPPEDRAQPAKPKRGLLALLEKLSIH